MSTSDQQTSYPMMYPKNVTNIHLEPTTHCNAACPQCPRNVYGSKHSPSKFKLTHFDINLLNVLDSESIEVVVINGNYGDIVMYPGGALALVKPLMKKFPHARIQIHTNGSALHKREWVEMGKLGISVEFGIDGLTQEVHQIYRQNTLLKRIFENAKSFIEAGGHAHWAMTVFHHNKDEVEKAKQLSLDMGFEKFTARPSIRFNNGRPSPILNDDFSTKKWIWPAEGADWKFDTATRAIEVQHIFQEMSKNKSIVIRNVSSEQETTDVTCWSKENASIYISAEGKVYPCCWTGRHELWENICNTLDVPNNFNLLSPENPLKAILFHKFWEKLDTTINEKRPMKPCANSCSKRSKYTEQLSRSKITTINT